MDTKAFLQHFNRILISAFPAILASLGSSGFWTDGVDNIRLVYTENRNAVTGIMVDVLAIWDGGIYVDYRFSVPKFLNILEKRKKEYIQLHQEEKETIESEFEKFKQMLLLKWVSE